MTATLEHTGSPDLGDAFPTVAWRTRRWAEMTPDAVAMRDKDFGIWQERTWATLWDEILTAAHGLLALGVRQRDVVSIHSEDRPEWVVLDLAAVAIRAMSTGLYPTNPSAEVLYLLNDSGSIIHLAEDQEQVDKITLQPDDAFPNISTIIFIEPRGLRTYADPRLLFWDDFLAKGREHREQHAGMVESIMAEAKSGDIMTLVYTSGTTGPPKGAMLDNTNADFAITKIINAEGRMSNGKPPGPSDTVLTYLPLGHVAERIFSTWTMCGNGAVLNFAESIETVQANLREVQPTVFFAVPRIWEKIHATIHIKLNDATFFKRLINAVGLRLAAFIGRVHLQEQICLLDRLSPRAPCPPGANRPQVLPVVRNGRSTDST